MKLLMLDRYLLQELAAHFLLSVFVFSLIAFFSDVLLTFLNDLQKVGLDFSKALELIALQFPRNVALVLPAASFLAVLLVVNNLNQTLQLVAMRMNGISLYRLALPAALLGSLGAGFSFWLNDMVIPACTLRTEAVKQEAIRSGQLPLGNRSFVFRDYDNEHQLRQLLYISDYQGKHLGNTTVVDLSKPSLFQIIQARSGQWSPERWIFTNANLYTISRKNTTLIFNHFGEFSLDNLMAREGERINDQLKSRFYSFTEMLAEIHHREARHQRVSHGAYINLWEKITLPLSCLGAVLTAVPLAISPPRAGSNRGFLFALATLFVYYLIRSVFVAVGQAGWMTFGGLLPAMLNGLLAAWLPVLLLISLGIYLLFRKTYVL